VTEEGRERIRAANLKHGYFSVMADEAIAALGEDPDDLKSLEQGAIEQWKPEGDFEYRLVQNLARALWKLERDERWHDSVAVRQVRRWAQNTDYYIREAESKCRKKQAALKRIQEAAKKEDFETGTRELDDFSDAFGSDTSDGPWSVYVLLHQLLKPGTPVEGTTPKEYEGLMAMKGVPIVVDHHRVPVRRELRERLEAAMEDLRDARDRRIEELRRESQDPFLRDVMSAPNHDQAALMRRSSDSNFRKVYRLTTLLLKIKGKSGRDQKKDVKYEGISQDVDENKGSPESIPPGRHDVDENKPVSAGCHDVYDDTGT